MKRLSIAVLCMLLFAAPVGCTGDLMRWAPTEAQKQAADVAVSDIRYLEGKVDVDAEIARWEAESASMATQSYIGLPKERVAPRTPASATAVTTAATDAARPQPTPSEILTATTEKGFTLLEALLGAATAVVVGVGSVKGIATINRIREGAEIARTAVAEIVAGIDGLPAEVKATVKAAQDQSATTETLVAEVKAAAKG